MKALLRLTLLLLVAVFLGPGVSAVAQSSMDPGYECIRSFHSDITVHEDSSMTVQETIEVNSAGVNIIHGIYRDFPTLYRDNHWLWRSTTFDVLSVTRDGNPEGYRIENEENGKRIFIGDPYTPVTNGVHTYIIRYNTARQIGFFKDHDELYWNVTGNGWAFDILKASATVSLPKGMSVGSIHLDGYTGGFGERYKAFESSVDTQGRVHFVARSMLPAHDGLTIVVSFPKGFVKQSSSSEQRNQMIRDNLGLLIPYGGLIFLIVFFVTIWYLLGRDPKTGTIVVGYEPPGGISPAAMRFVVNMGWDDKVLACAIVSMAVKGFYKITKKSSAYTITRGEADESVLSKDEACIAKELLSNKDSIVLGQSYKPAVKQAIDACNGSLRGNYENAYFRKNSGWMFLGTVICILVVVMSFTWVSRNVGHHGAEGSVFVVVLSTILLSTLVGAVGFWRDILSSLSGGGSGRTLRSASLAVLYTILTGLFGLALVSVFRSVLPSYMSPLYLIPLPVGVLVCIVFAKLLPARTPAGTKLYDEIEGFRLYLTATEGVQLSSFAPPEKTPALFEKYLPYAIALSVEQLWADQFTDILAAAGVTSSPTWYSGSDWNSRGITGFSSALGTSLSSSISSASTAPSSSSGGSSSGGSSGGGGGGGGGGGW